jgi:hypothetical protein
VIEKRILVPDRVRVPPREGFSWVDRRFLREHAPQLSHDAIFLYFFLAAVSDRHGLSYYKDATVAGRIRATEGRVARAREELLARDLLAFEAPLTQVLSLPAAKAAARGARAAETLARVLGRLAEGGS